MIELLFDAAVFVPHAVAALAAAALVRAVCRRLLEVAAWLADKSAWDVLWGDLSAVARWAGVLGVAR